MQTSAALSFFFPDHDAPVLTPLGEGNINHTWRVDLDNGTTFVLQRLHPTVFANPDAVMANIRIVTRHLAAAAGSGLSFFRLVTREDGADHCIDQQGCCWRLLTYIPGTRTLSRLQTPDQAREIGRLLGLFHLLTSDIMLEALADPLPGFHITPLYLDLFDTARATAGRLNALENQCCRWIDELRPWTGILEQAKAELSSRVIHGDPKVANFLFAANKERAVSLIDFDTVKPGLLLHDLGDCLRSCCNPLGEKPAQPADTTFEPVFFQAFLAGYLPQARHLLTPKDQELLVASSLVISFELGLRFFTDHLSGNHYFRIDSPGQNLHRALVQFHLCRSILSQYDELTRLFAALIGSDQTRD